jgi:hypothetical protein
VSQSSEVVPDTYEAALSATQELEALKAQMATQVPSKEVPAERTDLAIVREPAPVTAVHQAPEEPVPVAVVPREGKRADPPVKRARTTAAAPTVVPDSKASRYPANIPASLHEALAKDCEVTGLSMTARTLAALNAQEQHLYDVFPAPAVTAGTPGSIPVRATVRRRKNLPEPSVTVTLYLDAVQADAVALMASRVNAGSRSNLVTEALRRDLPD